MTNVAIRITAWHLHNRNLETYEFQYKTYKTRLSPSGGTLEVGTLAELKNARQITNNILYRNALDSITNHSYKITLTHGRSLDTLQNCIAPCHHYRHSQRPDDSLREELTSLLSDKRLILQAKKRVQHLKKHPIRLIFLPPIKSTLADYLF